MATNPKKANNGKSYELIKSFYEALRDKHKRLPPFETLDTEFEISRIEDERFLLRNVRSMISEKLAFIAHALNELLHPSEAGYVALRESTTFSDEEKTQILNLFSKIMHYDRWSLELAIQDSDELNVIFIEDVMKNWPAMKTSLIRYVKKLKESWTKEIALKDVGEYFG
ncbi:hypothetical protein HY772_02460 [Candidatus Woesearchaeota archaeon]|nr:hypothetical protein [Candidatus Woesearchaeota archaeon]